MEFESFFVETGEARLHCIGAGKGDLILFVHGFPEFSGAWRRQIEHFSSRFFAVAPDLRGFNLSDKPKDVEAYRPQHIVADLRGLIDKLGSGRAIVVAHDWGGAIAWNLAAQHPECVEKLVILNAPHPVLFARELAENADQQAASAYMNFFRTAQAEQKLAENDFAFLRAMMAGWKGGAGEIGADEWPAYRTAWSQPGALTGGLNYYRASPLHPPEGEQAKPRAKVAIDPARFRVNVPTLVIWGEKDKALLPSLLDGLEEFVPDLRIERLAQATHWIAHEFPERVNALIDDFIGR